MLLQAVQFISLLFIHRTPISTLFPYTTLFRSLRNRVYRYIWDEKNQNLVNPTLILDLPALPGPNHDGGKLVIGSDHYLYAVIDRKSTRLNSSHVSISYAVFCLKKKN